MLKPTLAAVVASLICLTASPSYAGAVGKACLKSNQPAANARLCKCIDKTARATLSFSHQNTAARLILRPSQAERVRTSSRKSDKDFWKKYTKFANTAEKRCK